MHVFSDDGDFKKVKPIASSCFGKGMHEPSNNFQDGCWSKPQTCSTDTVHVCRRLPIAPTSRKVATTKLSAAIAKHCRTRVKPAEHVGQSWVSSVDLPWGTCLRKAQLACRTVHFEVRILDLGGHRSGVYRQKGKLCHEP